MSATQLWECGVVVVTEDDKFRASREDVLHEPAQVVAPQALAGIGT